MSTKIEWATETWNPITGCSKISIKGVKGELYPCGEAAEEVFSTFDEAVDYKVDSEWISRKQDGEWADICPNCTS